MNIAITGGTGFLGGHLTRHLIATGHYPTVIARGVSPGTKAVRSLANINYNPIHLTDETKLYHAFKSCVAVAHLAGINREVGGVTFQDVHVKATEKVLFAAKKAGVQKIIFVSFLNARPSRQSAYHQTKWQAEELIRNSGLDYTIFKPGMIYGAGDHMLSHVSRALNISPFFAPVGLLPKHIRPVYVNDMCQLMSQAMIQNRLGRKTCSVLGPESLTLGQLVTRVAKAQNKIAINIPFTVNFHLALAMVLKATSKDPLVTRAQILMLAEAMDKASADSVELPEDLQPKTYLTEEIILASLSSLTK